MQNFKNFVFVIGSLLSFLVSVGQSPANKVNAQWVINKSIEAMGGEEYLLSVNTLYTEMATEMQGRPVTWVTREMLPNKGAFQIVYEGSIVYEDWFNGKMGYEKVNGKTTESDPKGLDDKFPRKNIFNELDFLDPSLYKLELLEDEKVNKSDCYKIKAEFITGDVRLLYIDKKSFNTLRQDRIKKGENRISSSTYYADFKNYGKLVFYSSLVIGEGDSAVKAKLTKLLINEGIEEADFNKK